MFWYHLAPLGSFTENERESDTYIHTECQQLQKRSLSCSFCVDEPLQTLHYYMLQKIKHFKSSTINILVPVKIKTP